MGEGKTPARAFDEASQRRFRVVLDAEGAADRAARYPEAANTSASAEERHSGYALRAATPGCRLIRPRPAAHVGGASAESLAEAAAVTLGSDQKVGTDVETLERASTLESE